MVGTAFEILRREGCMSGSGAVERMRKSALVLWLVTLSGIRLQEK